MSAHDLATLYRALDEAPAVAERELMAAMTEATMLLEREVKEYIPRGATGLTAASVTSDAFSTPAGVLGVIGSSQASALFVEEGRRPGKGVSKLGQEALGAWAKAVLGVSDKEKKGVAFLIARKIKREGIVAKRPFARALEDCGPEIDRMFESAVGRIGAQLTGGAA
ncbi:MAG TPA: hypothetical protein VLK85_06810 [Ramlibacter sp.]|nr:hypothetical protein [Ramlibacter sp.]